MKSKTMLCPGCWGSKKLLGDLKCDTCVGVGAIPDVRLSPHFLLSEFLRSQTAFRLKIPNVPTPKHIENLRLLCTTVLEPIRVEFGPIHINSGLRLPSLNSAIGGSSKKSAHMEGNAADLIPLRASVSLKEIMDWTIKSKVSYDQIIYEGTWFHVGRVSPTGKVRKQNLMMFPNRKGSPVYSIYNPKDPRVQS